MDNALSVTAVVTMSSREIAEQTDKQHGHVCRDIEMMFFELGESPEGSIQIWTHPQNAQRYREFRLDREHVECLLAGYSAVLRMKVIRRLRQLEQKEQIPQTLPDALRMAANLAEHNLALENQLAEAAPKAEFVDRYVTATGSMSFRQVCKLLQAKEPEFRCFLLDKGIMYRLGGVMTPHHQHTDAGRFEVKTGTTTVSNYSFSQARFTAKGVKWIAGMWAEHITRGGLM